MQRAYRLTGSKRFSAIHQGSRGWANRLLVLKGISNDLDRSRFGFLVGKRVGDAVTRNKVRRRLREAVRLTQVRVGWDIILIARRDAAAADYHRLKLATEDLLRRARLLADPVVPPPASEPPRHRGLEAPARDENPIETGGGSAFHQRRGSGRRGVKGLVLGCITIYQRGISPHFRSECRYQPTCSQYSREAVEGHGILHGGWLTLKRLARCHPLGGRGYDPVP